MQRYVRQIPDNLEEAISLNPAIFEKGRYAHYLESWFAVFNRESFCVLYLDVIAKNPEQVLRKL